MVNKDYHCRLHSEPKNRPASCHHNFVKMTNFHNSFTVILFKKFATQRSLNISWDLKCLVTLPCEML